MVLKILKIFGFIILGVFLVLFGISFSKVSKSSKTKLKDAWNNFLQLFKLAKTSSNPIKLLLGNTAEAIKNVFTPSSYSPTNITTVPSSGGTTGGTVSNEEVILMAFAGESNAGNQVHNDHASPSEIGVRNIKILNNSSLVFEPLNISGNNSIDQFAAPANSHGWDLGLANLVDAGAFGGKKVFLVNLSQGGSLIGQYNEGADTNYRNKIIARANAAMTALRSITNNITVYMVYSHGINDEVANILNENQFETATQNHLNFLNSQFGNNIKVVITKFGAFLKFNNALQNIVNSNSRYRAIETVGLSLQDAYHWGYSSQKYIITESVNILKTI
ncbi:hypothetical protein LV89_01857 [Arcicella aurantiaca]|uniref:Sialate O-acetylesterase domain-containing protein n=1 Tax=Arcicella aurantiaca TaxID=591202 RepID=A0A316ECE4_9BACT|nr:hypothetical protein [Arcicella aurantiaca]PWK27045.1 hypothetical protein LV89_01857 [Arcicella aurantiaca]